MLSGGIDANKTDDRCGDCGERQRPIEIAKKTADVAAQLAEAQVGVWAHDSWYSLGLYKKLGYPDQAIRIGFIHYNDADEVDRLVAGMESAQA